MAMAWITKINNDTNHQFSLYQNDPTYHPVIRVIDEIGREGLPRTYKPDEEIVVAPGARLKVEDCAIPQFFDAHAAKNTVPNTMPYGRLGIVGPEGSVEAFVTAGDPPSADPNKDYLRFRDAAQNILGQTCLGPLGPALVGGSSDFQLIFRDEPTSTGAVGFKLVAHTDPVNVMQIVADLRAIAALILAILTLGRPQPQQPSSVGSSGSG